MVRIAIPIWLLTASLAWAQETTARLTILGRNGAETVEVGPEGGLVPYRLLVETDPVGTPGNFGIWDVQITILTDTAIAQQPALALDPSFVSLFHLPVRSTGRPVEPGHIERIVVTPFCSPRRRGPCTNQTVEIGQSGALTVARGFLTVPSATVGSEFHARFLLEPSTELLHTGVGIVQALFSWEKGLSDRLLVNSLTILVVDEPPLPADFDEDGDVDLADFLWLAQCFEDSGRDRFDRCILAHADGFLRLSDCFEDSEQALIDRCFNADLDWDGDVDLADVISLMGMYTGAN